LVESALEGHNPQFNCHHHREDPEDFGPHPSGDSQEQKNILSIISIGGQQENEPLIVETSQDRHHASLNGKKQSSN
jgi:hypothetical protein